LNNGFLKVFKHIQRYDPTQASLYTWIRTVVVNSCLDFLKVKGRIEKHEEVTDKHDQGIPPSVIEKMKAEELLELVRKLSPAAQAVFNLYIMEGYSHKEIGVMLGISEGTSKWHLNHARTHLKKIITAQEVNYS
jgi:RNA polymerase sigma factor (sigma-70 family)